MKDAAGGETGRGAAKQAMIRPSPNGETPPCSRGAIPRCAGKSEARNPNYQSLRFRISARSAGGEPGELKHLSTRRKRKQKPRPLGEVVIPLVAVSERGTAQRVRGVLALSFTRLEASASPRGERLGEGLGRDRQRG